MADQASIAKMASTNAPTMGYRVTKTTVEVGSSTLSIADDVDVLVCGGGVAGISAAVAAARARCLSSGPAFSAARQPAR